MDRLLERVNAEAPRFVVHIGDLKTSDTSCANETYERVFQRFRKLEPPLAVTLGDNDWTDCHIPSAGSWDPLERLAYLRKALYSPLQFNQSLAITQQAQYPENLRWTADGVVFLTIHTVGKQNNLPRESKKKEGAFDVEALKDAAGSVAEFTQRNQANLTWIQEGFDQARSTDAKGIVIFTHADPLFEKKSKKRPGFEEMLTRIQQETLNFDRPVLFVHGSSHTFIMDKPLTVENNPEVGERGESIANFTRLQVFGDMDVQGVKVRIEPENPNLFLIEPLIIKENLRYRQSF